MGPFYSIQTRAQGTDLSRYWGSWRTSLLCYEDQLVASPFADEKNAIARQGWHMVEARVM
jgi:hypothetical protein